MSSILSANAFQNSALTNPTSESAFPTVTGGSTRVIVGPPPGLAGTQIEGRIIQVRLAVKVTGGTTTNFTLALYWYNSVNTDLTTFTGDIKIAATTAIAINSISGMYVMSADLAWDTISQRLMGAFEYFTTNTGAFTAKAATTVATGVTGCDKFKFFATGIFSGTNANNLCTISDFTLNLI